MLYLAAVMALAGMAPTAELLGCFDLHKHCRCGRVNAFAAAFELLHSNELDGHQHSGDEEEGSRNGRQNLQGQHWDVCVLRAALPSITPDAAKDVTQEVFAGLICGSAALHGPDRCPFEHALHTLTSLWIWFCTFSFAASLVCTMHSMCTR